MRRNFPPEFINRIDEVVTYQPLSAEAMGAILDLAIGDLQDHIDKRLGVEAFHVDLSAQARRFLLKRGTSEEYGARELKRVLQRELIQPLAALVAAGEVSPGANVRAEVGTRRDKLVFRTDQAFAPAC